MPFAMAGYDLVHHGEGRWNGVAIAAAAALASTTSSRTSATGRSATADPARPGRLAEDDFDPFDEARMVSRRWPAGMRVVTHLRAERAGRRIRRSTPASSPGSSASGAGWTETARPADAAAHRRRLQRRPDRRSTSGTRRPSTAATHVSPPERAAFAGAPRLGPHRRVPRRSAPSAGRYTWWDYRAGQLPQELRACASTTCWSRRRVAARLEWAEIDREARKGKPIPSDHAPLFVDLDEPGHPIDAGWAEAGDRIAARSGYRPG